MSGRMNDDIVLAGPLKDGKRYSVAITGGKLTPRDLRHVETMLALLRGFLEEDEASLPIPEPAEVEATVEPAP